MVQKKARSGVKIGAGALAGALAGVAAGYFLYGTKKGKNIRANAKPLAEKIKREVMSEARRFKSVGKADYLSIVDAVLKKHKAIAGVKREDVGRIAHELKRRWDEVEKKTRSAAKKAVRGAKRARAARR